MLSADLAKLQTNQDTAERMSIWNFKYSSFSIREGLHINMYILMHMKLQKEFIKFL